MVDNDLECEIWCNFSCYDGTWGRLSDFMTAVIELVVKRERLYVCAVDASTAFDKISRSYIWQKLFDTKIKPEFVLSIMEYY